MSYVTELYLSQIWTCCRSILVSQVYYTVLFFCRYLHVFYSTKSFHICSWIKLRTVSFYKYLLYHFLTLFLYKHSVFKVSFNMLTKLLISVLFYAYNMIGKTEYAVTSILWSQRHIRTLSTSKMEFFANRVNCWESLSIFAKNSIIDCI